MQATTICLATKHTGECALFFLLSLYIAFLGQPSLLYVNSCRGEALEVSMEIKEKEHHRGRGYTTVTMYWQSRSVGNVFFFFSLSDKKWNKIHHTGDKMACLSTNKILCCILTKSRFRRKKKTVNICP